MSNIALEEKIRNLSADYIYQQAVGSLLLLLMSAMEDAEKGVTALPYEIPADVQEIKEEIKAYLIRLEDLLESDAASRIVALEDCMELKKASAFHLRNHLQLFLPVEHHLHACQRPDCPAQI